MAMENRPMPPGVEVLVPHLREQYQRTFDQTSKNPKSAYITATIFRSQFFTWRFL